jgi:hypothetical protein
LECYKYGTGLKGRSNPSHTYLILKWIPASENLKSILPKEKTKLESKTSQKPRAVILKAQTLKTAIAETGEIRIGKGIKAENVSIQELYKNTKLDTIRPDTIVRRIKLSGD